MKLNPSIKNMSNEYIFFTDQTALTFRICLVQSYVMWQLMSPGCQTGISSIKCDKLKQNVLMPSVRNLLLKYRLVPQLLWGYNADKWPIHVAGALSPSSRESHYTLQKNYIGHRADFNMATNSSIHPLTMGNRNQILQPVTNHWRNELPCRVTMTETSLSQSSMMMMMMMMMTPPPPPSTTTNVTCREEPKQCGKDYLTR